MPIIVSEQTAFETFLNESIALFSAIKETTDLVAQKETEMIAEGFKKPNLKALVSSIKKSNKTLEQTFFKISAGAVAISQTQVDASLDTNIRGKLSGLMSKDITSAGIEKTKQDLLKNKLITAKSFGISPDVFKKMLEIYGKDASKFVKEGDVLITITEGFKLSQA